eukprot:8596776-Alexandrium_andersonii.AAC.1
MSASLVGSEMCIRDSFCNTRNESGERNLATNEKLLLLRSTRCQHSLHARDSLSDAPGRTNTSRNVDIAVHAAHVHVRAHVHVHVRVHVHAH